MRHIFKPLAFVITLTTTILLSFGFSRAISDSAEWRAAVKEALVSPSFLPEDPKTSKQIPDFELKDRNGTSVRLSQFASVDLIVINLWTTNCPACEAELPSLEEMDRRLSSVANAVLITITTNEKWSEVAHLFPMGTDLRILFDPETKVTEGLFGTTRFPETFILDKDRRVRARFDGERAWHSQDMLHFIAELSTL